MEGSISSPEKIPRRGTIAQRAAVGLEQKTMTISSPNTDSLRQERRETKEEFAKRVRKFQNENEIIPEEKPAKEEYQKSAVKKNEAVRARQQKHSSDSEKWVVHAREYKK